MVHQRTWTARVAADIGKRVAGYRKAHGLTAEQLAERCALPGITRVVITRLENGRRDSVSTAELQVLAKALDVPPVLLLFPVGLQEAVEVLPGVTADPWHAVRWFNGQSGNPADPGAQQPPEGRVLRYWQDNDRLAATISSAGERIAQADADSAAAVTTLEAEQHQRLAESEVRHLGTAVTALLNLRRTITEAGMLLPPLSPDVAGLLDDWSRRHPETEPGDRRADGDGLSVLAALAKQREPAHEEEPDGAH